MHFLVLVFIFFQVALKDIVSLLALPSHFLPAGNILHKLIKSYLFRNSLPKNDTFFHWIKANLHVRKRSQVCSALVTLILAESFIRIAKQLLMQQQR